MLALLLAGSLICASDDAPNAPSIRAAIERAVPLILMSTEEYPRHRDCFSCHHQAVPALALSLARSRGFAVPGDALPAIADLTARDLESALPSYREGKGQGGGATRAGYALWTLDLAGTPPDATIRDVARFLLGRDEDRGAWRTSSNRPPSEFSPFTTTYVALRALKTYRDGEDAERLEIRRAKIREWAAATPVRETEERVFQLLIHDAAGSPPEIIRGAVDALKERQRTDGGWTQRDDPDGASDAYATGSVLYALNRAGGVAPDDEAYRRGLGFLVRTQREDGSWHVASRSKPFQPYFESGFPHGQDQFISMAASSWAVAALTLASPVP